MAAHVADWLKHFLLLLGKHWKEFNKTGQEARIQRIRPSLCFSGRSEYQDGCLGCWISEAFSTPLDLKITEVNETWQKARSQRLLLRLCFSGQSVNQNGRPDRSVKKVAYCTHDIWPFGSLFSRNKALTPIETLRIFILIADKARSSDCHGTVCPCWNYHKDRWSINIGKIVSLSCEYM